MSVVITEITPKASTGRVLVKNRRREGGGQAWWVFDADPPRPGDTVRSHQSRSARSCTIPLEGGTFFKCPFLLPPSPHYRRLKKDTYITVSASFELGVQDAKKGLSLSPQRHMNTMKPAYRRGWLWQKIGRSEDKPWRDGMHDAWRVPNRDPAKLGSEKYGYVDNELSEYIHGFRQKAVLLEAARQYMQQPIQRTLQEVWETHPKIHDNHDFQGNYRRFEQLVFEQPLFHRKT